MIGSESSEKEILRRFAPQNNKVSMETLLCSVQEDRALGGC